jgi:hypothetical protein
MCTASTSLFSLFLVPGYVIGDRREYTAIPRWSGGVGGQTAVGAMVVDEVFEVSEQDHPFASRS